MKTEYSQKPDTFKETCPDEFTVFSWQDFIENQKLLKEVEEIKFREIWNGKVK